MKTLLILSIISLVGCTTYKVDEKGICRAPNGKIVNVADVDPDRYQKIFGKPGYADNSFYRYVVRITSLTTGGSCYGW